ncbi:MAG: alpha-galactosidase [Bacteroidales bacterium]
MKKLFLLMCILCLSSRLLIAQEPIRIQTKNTELILRVENKELKQVYFGEKLPENGTILNERGRYPAYSAFGLGEQNEVALHAVHADGNTSTKLDFVGVTQAQEGDDVTLTTIQLKDPVYPFFTTLYYKAYVNNDLIECWSEYKHQEKKPVTLYQFASGQLSLKNRSYWLTHFTGDWAGEFNEKQVELTEGIKIIDTKLGTRATFYNHPVSFISLDKPATEDEGEVVGLALAWPSNYRFLFEKNSQQELRVLAGMNPYASQYRLKKDEVFKTPSLMYSYSKNGKGEISRNFHSWARTHWLHNGDKDRYSLMNNWEATYFSFDEPALQSIIQDASKMGFDLFLLDDGWFGNKHPRNSDNAGLGDWQVNKEKLPNGIGWLVKECANNNIKFGIWLEPEMVNPKSELFEKHPDWVIQQPNREHRLFRNQLVLDLSNPKVQNFVFETVDQLLKENPDIAYVKWDCNRAITNGGSTYLAPEEQSHLWIDYGRGFLSVMDRVRTNHPDVHFMLCGGGGGRLDYGSLKYFEEYWPSDNTDALQRVFIQWGNSQFFPAIAMCCHVSASPNHQTQRRTPLKFRFDVAMSGKLGMDLQPRSMNENEIQFAKEAINTYNRIKNTIFTGDLYRILSPYENNVATLNYVSPEKDKAVFYAYRLKSHISEVSPKYKMKGLDPDKKYKLNEINIFPGEGSSISGLQETYTGAYLMNSGLSLRLNGDYDSVVLEVEEII